MDRVDILPDYRRGLLFYPNLLGPLKTPPEVVKEATKPAEPTRPNPVK